METLIKAALEQPSEFGHILKLTLKAHGYTIKSFSKVAGIPQNTLYKITLGQVRDFRMSTLRRICAPFNKKGPGLCLIRSLSRSFDLGMNWCLSKSILR